MRDLGNVIVIALLVTGSFLTGCASEAMNAGDTESVSVESSELFILFEQDGLTCEVKEGMLSLDQQGGLLTLVSSSKKTFPWKKRGFA